VVLLSGSDGSDDEEDENEEDEKLAEAVVSRAASGLSQAESERFAEEEAEPVLPRYDPEATAGTTMLASQGFQDRCFDIERVIGKLFLIRGTLPGAVCVIASALFSLVCSLPTCHLEAPM